MTDERDVERVLAEDFNAEVRDLLAAGMPVRSECSVDLTPELIAKLKKAVK